MAEWISDGEDGYPVRLKLNSLRDLVLTLTGETYLTLTGLTDVSFSNLSTNDVLTYNGSMWINSGFTGNFGSTGSSGISGSSGIDGNFYGSSGTSGIGETGSSGTSGTSGLSGESGTSGISGTSGSSGESGTSGISGSSGIDGNFYGSSGTSGIGETGSSGTSGTSGSSGESGTSGISGTSGSSGESGTSGISGTSGSSGESGTSGISGTSGSSGESGTSGISGTSGSSGESGTSGISPTGTTYDDFNYDPLTKTLYVDNMNVSGLTLTGMTDGILLSTNGVINSDSSFKIETLDWEFTNLLTTTGQTYILDLYSEYKYIIDTIRLQGDTGTGITTFYIDSTEIGGLTGITFKSNLQSYAATSSNTVSTTGKQVKFIITGLSGTPTLVRGKMKIIRT